MADETNSPALVGQIIDKVLKIRGRRVMLDSDLADLYGVSTSRLNEQVKRNKQRFPDDFMFQLNDDEFKNLKSQNATSSSWGGRRTPPSVFTEHGAVMLATVLKSDTAINMSVFIVRAFVELRQILLSNETLSMRIDEMEKQVQRQNSAINSINLAVAQLLKPPPPTRRKKIEGFKP